MNRELADIQDLKSAFVSHCRALGCENDYIKVCENKFEKLEEALKDLDWLKENLDLDFMNRLSVPEDKIRLLKIMGYEFDLEASCSNE